MVRRIAAVILTLSLICLLQGKPQAAAQGQEQAKKGVLQGAVTGKGKSSLMVKGPHDEKPRVFVPQTKDGHFDKHMLHVFHDLKVGSRVEVQWINDGHLRAVSIKILAQTGEPATTEKRTGSTAGTLVSQQKFFVEIQGAGEEKPRKYYINLKADPKLLQSVRQAPIGSRVLVHWVSTNHGPMIERFEVLRNQKSD